MVLKPEQSKKKKGKEEEPYTLRAEGVESPEPAACFWMDSNRKLGMV